ncbi:hypothetical protein AB0M43_20325 [Longispora sp. NPDC051575]|uniref:hypothetical protein n=1 Tax=Longispora sp. NPDC051575 TaxID=3154943 RepID=UPI00341256AC
MNRDVQRVRDLLGPADPALSAPVGPGDPTGLCLETEHDITPEGRAPVPRPRRAPRLALAGTFAAVLAVAGAVAVVTQLGGAPAAPTAAPGPGAVCLAALADGISPSTADDQTGRYKHVRITQYGRPSVEVTGQEPWKVTVADQWTAPDGSGRVAFVGGNAIDLPAVPGGSVSDGITYTRSRTALDEVDNLGRAASHLDRMARKAMLHRLADTPGVRCMGEMSDPSGRTGIAVTAFADQLGPNATALPGGVDCKPQHLSCQTTLIFDPRTGELLAQLTPTPGDPAKTAYTMYSDRSRTDVLGQL